jgi:hypothetical protein
MSCLKTPCDFCIRVCLYEQLTVNADLFCMFVELKYAYLYKKGKKVQLSLCLTN